MKQSGLGGLSFDEGQFSVFGYVPGSPKRFLYIINKYLLVFKAYLSGPLFGYFLTFITLSSNDFFM